MTGVGLLQVNGVATPRVAWWRWPALYLASALFVLDALIMGQGLLAASMLLVVITWLVPKATLFFMVGRNGWPVARLAALLAAAAVAIMLTINFNNGLAARRAQRLISAIELYRAASGHYPDSLEVLIPRYLETIPPAKYTLAYNRFLYSKHPRRVVLGYVEVPPYGRSFYDFERRRWDFLD